MKHVLPSKWIIVACSALIMALVTAPVYSVSGILIPVITAELGVSRAAFSVHISICMAASMLGSLTVGSLVRRLGIKPMLLISIVSVGAAFIAYSRATQL